MEAVAHEGANNKVNTMKNSEERIEHTDSVPDVMMKLSEDNFGALDVCASIRERTPQIDPDNVMGGLGVFLSLDTNQIYGSRIWMLYKDVCGEDLPTMLALLRARQLSVSVLLKGAAKRRLVAAKYVD